jgi:hypothetical protein
MSTCTFNIDGVELAGDLAKVDRSDLYGETRIKVLDKDEKPLAKAAVPEDGGCYIGKGEVRLVQQVNENFSLARTETVNPLTGEPKETIPSSFKATPAFRRALPEEVSLLETQAVYRIQGAEDRLKPGYMFLGTFNYRSGIEKKDAAIITNGTGVFLLVGNLKAPLFVGMEADSQLIMAESAAGEDEAEGDFSSLL